MDEFQPRAGVDDAERAEGWPWRRALVVVGLVLVVMILVVAIYAGAFIILAPMMQ
ncbi:MAG TPA: hypothetical protein VHU62_12290 [Mycobacterium sp.]|nr:hypothetical protein [Mycobacterium sp.]